MSGMSCRCIKRDTVVQNDIACCGVEIRAHALRLTRCAILKPTQPNYTWTAHADMFINMHSIALDNALDHHNNEISRKE